MSQNENVYTRMDNIMTRYKDMGIEVTSTMVAWIVVTEDERGEKVLPQAPESTAPPGPTQV